MNRKEFEQELQYAFRDSALLTKALTHSSYCREKGLAPNQSNERLEFLGDAFLDAITGAELYKRLYSVNEGKLTKTRALVVCEKSLAKVGRRLRIGEVLRMGNGEEKTGGRDRESIVADATEAVIGAIYLDGGYEEVSRFVLREFGYLIYQALNGRLFSDYKTEVQEILQQGGAEPQIEYKVTKESGPDHDKTFYVDLIVNGECCGSGVGKTKKEAEQNAARASLEKGKREHVL